MKSIFLITLSTLFSIYIGAQTTIFVSAPDYIGKYAILNTSEDPVTYSNKKIDKKLIDSTGLFTFQVDTNIVLKAYIDIGSTSGFLYIDPTTESYHIYFPKKESDTRLNNNSVSLIFDSLSKNDLNTLILEFNYRIDDFLYGDTLSKQRLLLQNDSFKDSLNQLKKVLIEAYRPIKNKYFHEYIKYTIANLEQLYMGRGMLKNKIYIFETYISNKPILYHNDAYFDFFKLNFEHFFMTNIGLIDKIRHAIDNYSSAEKLDEVLINSPFLRNDTIRELVTILNLNKAYYKKSFNTTNIKSVLSQILERSKIKEHQLIVTNLLKQYNLLIQGSDAPSFTLYTPKNDTVNLSAFLGKYVYVQFWSTWNQASLQEIKIMEDMETKYGKYIEFVSISLDESEQDFIDWRLKNHKYNWTFAHYKGENDLLINYAIKSVPSYVLIDQKGKIVDAHAMSPAPNYPKPSIDKTFFFIKKKEEPNIKRNVGGKLN